MPACPFVMPDPRVRPPAPFGTSRRDFLRTTALTGAALVLGLRAGRIVRADEAGASTAFRPNEWILLDPDGWITLTVGKSEMGQGVRTSLPMILADEMEADWKQIRLVQARPGPPFKRLGTGGSWSLGGSWKLLRKAGATVRELFLTAAAARWQVEAGECSATLGVITHAKSGRSLAYAELIPDARALPLPENPPLKARSAFRLIGQRIPRTDTPAIVTGAARFGIDTRVPGMLFASVERPPVPGAKALRSQEEKARSVPGVRDIIRLGDAFAVVANGHWPAQQGRAALAVEWSTPENASFASASHRAHLEKAALESGFVTREVKAPAGSGAAERTIEALYTYGFFAHAPLETMNCTAHVQGDRCTLWAPTQSPNSLQELIAKRFGFDPASVEINVTLIGGGFGRRLANDYEAEAVELSRAMKAPVQVLWTRADDLRLGHFQGASAHRLQGGLDASGQLVSWSHTKAGSFHNLNGPPDAKDLSDPEFFRDNSWGVYDVPYAVPAIRTAYVAVDLPIRHGPWRAVFAPASVFARESFVDEIAAARRADPLDFRLELLRGPDLVEAGTLKIDRRRLRRVLEAAREVSAWGSALAKGRGRGVACNVYDGTTHVAYVVEVTVSDAGVIKVDRVVAVVDCGLVVNPSGVEQQVEGGIVWALSSTLHGEMTFRNGRAEQSSLAEFPIARIHDLPAIEIHLLPSDLDQPYGMGEPTVPPLAPAIANAVFAATGRRLRTLPMRPEHLRA